MQSIETNLKKKTFMAQIPEETNPLLALNLSQADCLSLNANNEWNNFALQKNSTLIEAPIALARLYAKSSQHITKEHPKLTDESKLYMGTITWSIHAT
jgi:hypothetical protein